MMWMTGEMIPKKMLHTKMEEKRLRGRPRIIWIGQIRGLQKLEGKSRKKYKKTGSGRIETAGDFSVIVNSYHRGILKNVADVLFFTKIDNFCEP